MKVILLAGGFGTRLSNGSESLPKPMVQIGGKPIIWHIMNSYAHWGHKDFYLALGYKSDLIKKYFLDYHKINSDLTINLETGDIKKYPTEKLDWKITLVDTGLNSMTGGRLRRLKKFIGDDSFMLTYGDGVSDVEIDKLIKFHKSHGKLVTVTAVRPTARFGELSIIENRVTSFKEKPQGTHGWINGGYFIMEPEFLDLIENDETVLEGGPLEEAAKMGELMAYNHQGFWQCMDTKRDLDYLEGLWNSAEKAPWVR